jgi:tetratricopeptide (TPR) repeat protein
MSQISSVAIVLLLVVVLALEFSTILSTIGTGAILAALMIVGTAVSGLGAVTGAILKKDGTRLTNGRIRYVSSARSYEFTAQTGAKARVPKSQVADIWVPQPPALKQALQDVQTGRYTQAIPVLKKIVTDYDNLKWDLVAGASLAKAYLKTNKPDQAIRLCESIIRKEPRAAGHPVMAPVYWDALLKTGQTDRLSLALSKATAQGDRRIAAIAQVKRGDIMAKKGDHKMALIDGYLRTVLLFRDIPEAQPEALYKAIQAFQKINQHGQADRLRKTLLAEHPESHYTRMLRGTP